MKSRQIALFLVISVIYACPCFGQGMAEMAGTHAGVAGLGAGLSSGGLNHGHAVGHSYESAAASLSRASSNASSVRPGHGQVANVGRSRQMLFQTSGSPANQNKVIDQYMKIGSNFEAKKRWTEAEESYKYVLRIIASRDGPGSVESVPVLEHLVVVNLAQDKLNDAISLQKTVINFKKASPDHDFGAIVKADNDLSALYEKRGDYASADPVLKDSVGICNTEKSSISTGQRRVTLDSYVRVLRKLKKDVEADEIENEEKKFSQSNAQPSAIKSEGLR